ELYTEDDFRQLVVAIEATPTSFGSLGELEDHGERGLVRETSFGEFPPGLRTLAHTVGEADKLLPALGCGSDDDEQALRGVFETGLHVNAVDPEVDVAFGREIALAPARLLLGPGLLEASNGRGREPAGVPAEQCDQRVREVAGRDALEVEDRDQHLQALRPTRVGRQNRRRKADALGTLAAAVTHARAAHG